MTARTFKMRLKKALGVERFNELTIYIRDSYLNGVNEGGSGHIVHNKTGLCIYVDLKTLRVGPSSIRNKMMIRYAESIHDFSSNRLGIKGRNIWVTEDKLYKSIWIMLNDVEKGMRL